MRQVPDVDGPVEAARGQTLPVRTERHPAHHAWMTAVGANLFEAGLGVPELHGVIPSRCGVPSRHGLVPARRGDAPAIGAKGQAPDLVAVSTEYESLPGDIRSQCSRVPDLRGPVPAGRGETLAV